MYSLLKFNHFVLLKPASIIIYTVSIVLCPLDGYGARCLDTGQNQVFGARSGWCSRHITIKTCN